MNTHDQILTGTDKGNKTYSFDETHDPNLPAELWFQPSHEGLTLFVVFYSQACRWSRCLGCNLPSLMSSNHVNYDSLMTQIDNLFAKPEVVEQMQRDRFEQRLRATIVQEGRVQGHAPQGLGAKLQVRVRTGDRGELRPAKADLIGEVGPHVVQQQIRIGVDRSS